MSVNPLTSATHTTATALAVTTNAASAVSTANTTAALPSIPENSVAATASEASNVTRASDEAFAHLNQMFHTYMDRLMNLSWKETETHESFISFKSLYGSKRVKPPVATAPPVDFGKGAEEMNKNADDLEDLGYYMNEAANKIRTSDTNSSTTRASAEWVFNNFKTMNAYGQSFYRTADHTGEPAIYAGQSENKQRAGLGILTCRAENSRYTGLWYNDNKHGSALYEYSKNPRRVKQSF